jgi:hypothetical protein
LCALSTADSQAEHTGNRSDADHAPCNCFEVAVQVPHVMLRCAVLCAGVVIVSVSSSGFMEQVHWSVGAAAAVAATAGDSSSSDGAVMGLVSASSDASSLSIKLVSAADGAEFGTAVVQMPAPSYPVSGPAATVVAAWLDASKCKASGSSKGGALSGCRLLVLWSDDQLTYVEDGEVAWSREEALATGSSSLISELPTAKAAAGGADAEDSSSGSSSGSSKGGLLGLLQDKERMKQWVRLQVLGVYVQFKLNTDAEKEEFYQLRQALRWVPERPANAGGYVSGGLWFTVACWQQLTDEGSCSTFNLGC